MKKPNAISIVTIPLFLAVFVVVLLLQCPVQADYLKMNPPPDVDKVFHHHGNASSCWVAAAANMLAGAGYGDGDNVQERADDIYDEMCADANISCCRGCYGWADTALRVWLASDDNKWKDSNPYTVVTVHAADPDCKVNRNPWADPNLPMFIGNKLRKCNMLRLSILKPNKTCGHAITAWGDNRDSNDLTVNPTRVKVTDSDSPYNITGDVQTYTYDDYDNPNPEGSNQGVGWYINYNYSEANHRYIDNVVTLAPSNFITWPFTLAATWKAVGSYKIKQDSATDATDLHYRVGSDGPILSYRTSISWDNNDVPPGIGENKSPPTRITVDWDLSDNPVPDGNEVTITTEFVLPVAAIIVNTMDHNSVRFTYPADGLDKPGFGWLMTSLKLATPVEPNATGGYIIGAFDIYDNPGGGEQDIVGRYRFINEYLYDEDPEHHDFVLNGTPQTGYWVGNFRFGHSYALLDDQALWQFSNWLPFTPPAPYIYQLIPGGVPPMNISWEGLLPYPKGQDYNPPIPQECGDPGTSYEAGDINRDCTVDFRDFAEFANTWLRCTDPQGCCG